MYGTRSQTFQTFGNQEFRNCFQQPNNNSLQNGVGVAYPNSRPRPPPPREKSRFQMNLCLVCNTTFVAEKAASFDIGLFNFFNMCHVLQVPTYQEFVPQTNPLCTHCSRTVDEYIKLQAEIKELMDNLGEMRKQLGEDLVESYETTPSSMKNYEVKTKIYNIWRQKINAGKTKGGGGGGQAVAGESSTGFQSNSTEVANSVNDGRKATEEQQQNKNQGQGLPNYTLLDISNSVPSSVSNQGGVSATVSVADNIENDNSNLSMECPSPASLPDAFDDNDDGPSSDHNKEVYVKNLNDVVGEELNTNMKTENGSNKTAKVNENEKSGVGPTPTVESLETGGNSSTNKPKAKEQQWIDRRRFRAIFTAQRRSYPCKFCGKLFPALFSLQLHERIHTGEKPFKCSICSRAFAAKAAMQKHEKTHDNSRYEGEPQYECDLCGKKYHLERSLYNHKRDHLGIKRLRRRRKPKNPYAPSSKKKYPKNPNAPSSKKRYPKNPNAPSYRKRYKPKKDPDAPPKPTRPRKKPVKLDEDGNPIPEDPNLKRRRRRSPKPTLNKSKRQSLFPRRKPGTPKEAICQYCGKDFVEGYRLRQHLLVHTGEKPLKCPFTDCPKAFALKCNLYKHLRTHDKSRFEGEPTHMCDYCGKGFYVLSTLYHHRRRVHLGMEKNYERKKARNQPCECTICGKTLPTSYALDAHRIKHSEPKFKCEICSKPFYRKLDAIDHTKRHEPTWMYNRYFRYKCTACPPEQLGFSSKTAIQEHWAANHKDEKLPDEFKNPPKQKKPIIPGKYVCTLCPEGNQPKYNYSGSLLKHKKSYHMGKSRKWSPRGKGGIAGRKKWNNKSEDKFSSSGNSSEEEDMDLDKKPDTKPETDNQPVRRSARQTRGDISNIASLLKESDGDESFDEEEIPIVSPPKRARIVRTPVKPKPAAKIPSRTNKKSTRSTPKNQNASKFTDEYINRILNWRQVSVLLTRVDSQDQEESVPWMGSNELKCSQVQPKPIPKFSKPNVARRRGKPLGKRNQSEPSVPIVLESISIDSEDASISGMENLQMDPVENPLADDVKEEPDGDDDENSDSEYTSADYISKSIPQASASGTKRPNFFAPMIIHNPLSKNKAAKPIVLSLLPPAPTTAGTGGENSEESTDNVVCKKENQNASSADNDTNEAVLGF